MCVCELKDWESKVKDQEIDFNYSANSAIAIMRYRVMIKCKVYDTGVIYREK